MSIALCVSGWHDLAKTSTPSATCWPVCLAWTSRLVSQTVFRSSGSTSAQGGGVLPALCRSSLQSLRRQFASPHDIYTHTMVWFLGVQLSNHLHPISVTFSARPTPPPAVAFQSPGQKGSRRSRIQPYRQPWSRSASFLTRPMASRSSSCDLQNRKANRSPVSQNNIPAGFSI